MFDGMEPIGQNWPLSEDTQTEEQRRCALCFHFFPKDEMERVQLDEPGAWNWICSECLEKVQTDQPDKPRMEETA